MIQAIAGTSDRRHKSLLLLLFQDDDASCRPRFSGFISLCQAGREGSYLVPLNWCPAGALFSADPCVQAPTACLVPWQTSHFNRRRPVAHLLSDYMPMPGGYETPE